MLKALATGGASLIRSQIVSLLLWRDYAVCILDNLESATHFEGCPASIAAEVEDALKRARVVRQASQV
jgi:UDP-glucose 4-epimerase